MPLASFNLHVSNEIAAAIDATPFLVFADHHTAWLHVAIVLPALLFSVLATARACGAQKNQGTRLAAISMGPLFFAIILCGRWPHLFQNTFFSPDESQLIAGGITLLHHPIFWKYVDGHTAGPLDFYVITLLGVFRAPLNYFSARVLAAAFQAGSVWFTYRILRLDTTSRLAAAAVSPLLCYYAWINEWDNIMYSSEQLPTFLLIGAFYFLYRGLRLNSGRCFVIGGALAGAVPWAKLQGLPVSVGLIAGGVVAVLAAREKPAEQRRSHIIRALIGFAAPSLFFAVLILAGQQQETFYRSYLAANFAYTASGIGKFQTLLDQWAQMENLRALVVAALAWGLVAGYRHRKALGPSSAGAWLLAALSAAVCVAPGRSFAHYTLFLAAPFGLLLAFGFSAIPNALEVGSTRRRVAIIAFALTAVAPLLLYRLRWTNTADRQLANYWNLPPSILAQKLRPHLSGDDALAVWGWFPHLYVELQAPQGVRDAHTERAMRPSPLQSYYQTRILDDLKTHPPVAFVDAVGPRSMLFKDPNVYGLQAYPEIADFVMENYHVIFEGEDGKIYLRNDRS